MHTLIGRTGLYACVTFRTVCVTYVHGLYLWFLSSWNVVYLINY